MSDYFEIYKVKFDYKLNNLLRQNRGALAELFQCSSIFS